MSDFLLLEACTARFSDGPKPWSPLPPSK